MPRNIYNSKVNDINYYQKALKYEQKIEILANNPLYQTYFKQKIDKYQKKIEQIKQLNNYK